MSGAEYLSVVELNPYSKLENQPDQDLAIQELKSVKEAFEASGIEVIKVDAPKDCQDGIYTANWGLCWQGKTVMSSLPNLRRDEEAYARQVLESLGRKVIIPPYRFSGQGDALPCGDYLFVGSHYRTDPRMHEFLESVFDCQVIGLRTVPELDKANQPVINAVTGWPDSYFYDLDIALSVLAPDLIAWCPEAFDQPSQEKIAGLPINKIEVSLHEARDAFACNLVSTGENVIMSDRAPLYQAELERRGFKTLTPHITELSKGGGYIRCCSLTLD